MKPLSPEEHDVIWGKGTEKPFTGEYDAFYPKGGCFVCRACDNPLYSALAKFNSGCGWPSFDKCFVGAVRTEADPSISGRLRTEILCAKCGGHLGHVFSGERHTAANERHCVNSLSVRFREGDLSTAEEKLL
ncbi:MAG: uncharacterized protein KVP18_003216 [Porospora cf. gigantea A]|uniref:uncharacterized protein n=1 Tax=Porospora cf. gigantea A TaxID=2853593 RepID=UPI0035593D8F|nr:MAG: hypothetical protein KVP18_003216 [Porospora cf. gigantea A]